MLFLELFRSYKAHHTFSRKVPKALKTGALWLFLHFLKHHGTFKSKAMHGSTMLLGQIILPQIHFGRWIGILDAPKATLCLFLNTLHVNPAFMHSVHSEGFPSNLIASIAELCCEFVGHISSLIKTSTNYVLKFSP